MTFTEIKTKILNKVQDLEVHNHGVIKSKAVYEQRMAAMNEMIELLDNALQEYPEQSLLDLKCRIKQSIRIMELAKSCGFINEP